MALPSPGDHGPNYTMSSFGIAPEKRRVHYDQVIINRNTLSVTESRHVVHGLSSAVTARVSHGPT